MPPEVDTELAAALRTAKAKPMNFAFVAKGASDGKLLVSKMPIPAKKVNEAKADLGGGLIFKGRCFGEEGQMVFEVAKEPPGTLAKAIKKVISEAAGLTLRVEVRVNQGLEEEEAPTSQTQEAPESPKESPTPSAVPGAEARAQLLQRLRTLTPNYQAVVARKGPEASLLQKMLAAFQAAMGKQSFVLAAKAITELEGLVARSLTNPGASPQAPPGPGAETWQKRLTALTPGLKQVLQANGPSAPQVKQLFAQASALAQKKDYPAACAVLDRLEPLVKQAPTAPPGGLSLVKLGKARVEWIGVRRQAVQDIKRLQGAIETEFKDDPEQKAQLAAALKKLDGLIPQLNEDLENQLDAVLNARDEGQRADLTKTAKATMARFVQFLDSDPIMAELDGNEVLPDLQVAEPLRAKLRDIAGGLGGS